MDGGPSHYETFDPKPEAPVEIRGEFGTIATQTPGIHFSQPMKRLAAISDDSRSFARFVTTKETTAPATTT